MSPTASPIFPLDEIFQPIFTREALLAIEDKLARDPYTTPDHTMVYFHGERALHQALRDGKQQQQSEFSCVSSGAVTYFPPHTRTAAEANAHWQALDPAWDPSPARDHLLGWVRSPARAAAVAQVDKVFGFGLGPVCAGAVTPIYLPGVHLLEHMAVLSVAAEIARLNNNSRSVTVYTADPGYTAECKKALAAMGVQVVDGFGARGFTMVDERSIVFTKYPSFPVREILADLCRPIALIGNRQRTRAEVAAQDDYARQEAGDPDTERTRKMMQEYDEGSEIQLSVFGQQYWHWKR